MGERSA